MLEYPRYYIVDHEIPVKIELDQEGMVVATNYLGYEYGIGKVYAEGYEVTQEVYEKAKKELLQSLDKRALTNASVSE